MAGSWGHMVVDGPSAPEDASNYTAEDIGKPYRDSDGSFPLIENMGDAVEALEECYGMVQWLAQRLAEANVNPIIGPLFDRAYWIDQAQRFYRQGYELGAGEPPRW